MLTNQKPFANKVKSLLAAGQPAWGSGLLDASDILAKYTVETGVDFLWIDLEHRPYDYDAIRYVPLLCRARHCEPIIRVAGLEDHLIKKALDIGASGVMVPHINHAEDARRAVEYARYAPQGRRGVSPWWTLMTNVTYEEYLPHANLETLVSVQIETPEGIAHFDEICAVDGVDVVFAGPTDLAAALGHIDDLTHPEVQRFIAEFPRRVAAHGKTAGISIRGLEAAREAYRQGYRFIVIGHVVSFGVPALRGCLDQLRKGNGS